MQKCWSGTVTRNTIMRRTVGCLDLTKPNQAALESNLDYTAAVRTRGALALQIHTVQESVDLASFLGKA